MTRILTIGHSNHTLAHFLDLLRMHSVRTVVDVRSYPTSRHVPHFALPGLARALREEGIEYVFLGRELGGRPRWRELYDEFGKVNYARLRSTTAFARGVEALLKLAAKDTTALLCAEENPAICHRRILVGAAVSDRGAEVWHIRGDSSLQADSEVIGSGKRQPRRLLEERQGGECTCGAVALFTIGFAGRTAEQFFGTLSAHGVRRVIDVRLKNQSQLAGFTKRQDLPYFLRRLCRAEYSHEVRLAPTDALLSAYRVEGDWASYERAFVALLRERDASRLIPRRQILTPTALLCSEPTAERCHRRLVAEYLRDQLGNLQIVHL